MVVFATLAAADVPLPQTFPVGNSPEDVAFDGANLWVSNSDNGNGNGTVTKLGPNGTVLGTFSLGFAGGVCSGGTNVWVTSGSNSVTKLKASDGTVLGTFAVGTEARDCAFDGTSIWVTNRISGDVTKLRASDGANQGTFPVGTFPWGELFDGSNLWVALEGDGSVAKVDTSSGALLATFPTGTNPLHMAFDGQNVWVTNNASNTVMKLRASDGTNLGSFAVQGPYGIAFDGANIWVVSNDNNAVSVLRASNGTLLGTRSTDGTDSRGAAFDGTNIWVVNSGSDTVSRFNGCSGNVCDASTPTDTPTVTPTLTNTPTLTPTTTGTPPTHTPTPTVACAVIAKPKLTISKLHTPPGDDTLSFDGYIGLPFPVSPPLDPLNDGFQLEVTSTSGSVLDLTIPGGAYANPPGVGWKVSGGGRKWSYSDKTASPPGGIYKVVVQDKSSATLGVGSTRLTVKGKRGSYPVSGGELPLITSVVLSPSQCGEIRFAGPPPAPICEFNKRGSTLKCK